MLSFDTTDLKEVARQFRSWRSHYNRKPYPVSLWNAAIHHAQKLSIAEVASLIGVSLDYLRVKMQLPRHKKTSAVSTGKTTKNTSPFIEVLSSPVQKKPLSLVEIRISRGCELEMTMKFEGSLEEAIPIIEHLFCKGEAI